MRTWLLLRSRGAEVIVPPLTAAATIAMGMIVKIRKPTVSLFRGPSG